MQLGLLKAKHLFGFFQRGLWSHAGTEVSAALGGPGRIGDERSFGVDYLAPAYAGGC